MNVVRLHSDVLRRRVTSRIPTEHGEFQLYLYTNGSDLKEHVALVCGEVSGKSHVLVRVHSECFTGEVIGSSRCDCREQLHLAMQQIAEEGCGALVYLRQEGRGIGLIDKLRAYNLQDQGYDTVDANLLLGHQPDERDYTIAALILDDLQVRSIRLLTNNPLKITSLRTLGIRVERQIPIHPTVNASNVRYLLTKARRMHHLLSISDIAALQDELAAVTSWKGEVIPNPWNNDRPSYHARAHRTSLYFTGTRAISIQEEGLSHVEASDVQVETLLSAISSGTESLIYRGEFPQDMPIDESIADLPGIFAYPLKYGYATVGQVIATGSDVDVEWEGRIVMAFHPHESHFNVPPDTLIPVPDDIPVEDALFLPNMETAINFVMDGSPLVGEHVVVFGQGIVGLLTASVLAHFPIAKLITLDRHERRRDASYELGTTATLDPQDEDLQELLREHLPNGADLTYELSGSPIALDQALEATGYTGRIVVGSWYGNKRASLNLGGRFHRSRIRLISSQVSSIAPRFAGRWTKARRFETAWDMIRQIRPSRFITHRFPIEDAAHAYQLLDQKPEEAIQVLFTYQAQRGID
ncbi:MAG: GTP cyclohydrolase II [Halobacteriota archaeon]